ncbi:MAG: putative ABC transporter permease [Saccharofermentans sp.]|nr:putative ABC transporter permease [Saccharofermentans sp.]
MSLPYPFLESYLMFFIYSFVGWVVEVVYYGLTEGKFINRGFLAGPLCPVYGLGFYAAIWLFEPFRNNFFIIFFGMASACTLVELIAGVILYHTFHMRWWDYSDYKFNFRGYICLRFFVYWGIAASLGIYVLHPTVKWLIAHINTPVRLGIAIGLSVVLVADIITTIITIIGFKKKFASIVKMTSGVKGVSDLIGSQIYSAVDTIVTVSEPTRNHYDQYRKLIEQNRQQERELAAQHRAEEKAFANQFTEVEKESLRIAKDQAVSTIGSLVRSFKKNEQRLVKVVSLRPSDAGAAVMRFIKKRTGNDDAELFAIEEDDSIEKDTKEYNKRDIC